MVQAIRMEKHGGPEVLSWTENALAEPGPGQALIRHSAVGLNFIDTYHRSGLYPIELPSGLGIEAAGVVEAVGPAVDGFKPGDRVAYLFVPILDAYSQARLIDVDHLIRLPDGISYEAGAAMLLKGMTAWYLLKASYVVKPGDDVLIYAAAGGVGLIACQWAKALGARVIGIVSTQEKAALATENGCDDIVMADADVVAQVRDLTNGAGVAAVYDSVGKDTFIQSLDCLKTHGTMVTYGNATGPVDPFAPSELAQRGSLFVTRPILFHFIADKADRDRIAADLIDVVESGTVKIQVNQRYPLAEAARAHEDLEARRTTGSTVLIP